MADSFDPADLAGNGIDLNALFSTERQPEISQAFRVMWERLSEIFERPDLEVDKKSFKALKAMTKEHVHKQDDSATCAICIDNLCNSVDIPEEYIIKEELKADVDSFRSSVVVMPCKHRYHYFCLTLWLEKEQSCPTCRHKVKTDAEFEDDERKKNIEELHDSMYS